MSKNAIRCPAMKLRPKLIIDPNNDIKTKDEGKPNIIYSSKKSFQHSPMHNKDALHTNPIDSPYVGYNLKNAKLSDEPNIDTAGIEYLDRNESKKELCLSLMQHKAEERSLSNGIQYSPIIPIRVAKNSIKKIDVFLHEYIKSQIQVFSTRNNLKKMTTLLQDH